jgi:hypothetical protein
LSERQVTSSLIPLSPCFVVSFVGSLIWEQDQVLWAVVARVVVLVVHDLLGKKAPTNDLFHDESMSPHVSAPCLRMIRLPGEHVAIGLDLEAAPPQGMTFAAVSDPSAPSATEARRVLDLVIGGHVPLDMRPADRTIVENVRA